jgi:hypothetical protein
MKNKIALALLSIIILLAFAPQAKAAQYARPSGTVITNNWSASGAATLHEATDETTASDADYATSGKFNVTCEINLSTIIDPQVSNGHILRYRVSISGGGNESTLFELLDNGSLVASWSESNTGGAYVDRVQNLNTAQTDSIGNYAALTLRITTSGQRNGEETRVSWIEFEVPSSSGPPTIINPTVSGIGGTSATLGADVTDDGGDPPVSDRGTVWKSSPGVTITDNPASQGSGLGQFFHARAVPAKTIVYYAGYATNATGTTVSAEDSFRTEPDTQEPTAFIDNQGASDMRINWSNTHTGDGVIVLIKENGAVDANPVDGTVYTGNSVYPNGSQIGTGNRVVYIGDGLPSSNVTVTNLSPGSTYFVAVYAYAGSGTGQTGINYIQTAPPTASQLIIGPPALTTVSASNIQSATADLQITVFSDGGGTITQHGTMWNMTGAPAIENQTSLGTYGGAVPGLFTDSTSGLTPASLIYFRGYGTNADGTSYSADGTFYTEPSVQAGPITISDITESGMRLNWTRGNGDGVMLVIKQDAAVSVGPTDGVEPIANASFGAGAALGAGNYVAYRGIGTFIDVTDLIAGHVYHVAVYEYKGSGPGSSGVNYREESPATNNQLIVGYPTITSPTFSNIDATSATLGAEVTNDGGDNLSARGTIWNTNGMPDLVKNPANAQSINGQLGSFTHSHINLQSNSRIYFRGYATNSFGTSYSSQLYFHTEPAIAPTSITSPNKAYNFITITWTKGDANSHIVIVKQGSPVDAAPADGVEYNWHSILGDGDQIGTGNYVVYAGRNSYVSFAGLTPSTTYHIAVYSYTGSGVGISGINYLQASPAVSNQITEVVPFGHNGAHDVDCTECHVMHAGGFVPRDDVQEAVCVSCHNPGGEAAAKVDFAMHTTSGGTMDCGTCHEMHNKYDFNTSDTHAGGIIAENTSWMRWDTTKYLPAALEPAIYHGPPENTDDFWGFTSTPYNGICQTCHTSTGHHTNTGVDPLHPQERGDYVGQPCISCHAHTDGFAPVVIGGSCLDAGCHDQAQTSRRDIDADFAMTSHHVSGGAAVEADCLVCHIDKPGTLHQNGVINLRDPDTGTHIQYQGSDYSFTTITRDTGSSGTDVLEEWVTVVQDEFCFKCHDSDASRGSGLGGAAYLGGTAMTPFSTAAAVPEVYGRFDTANSYHHSVRGAGSNPYTVPHNGFTTMVAPWNQDATHDVISCFDCHETNTHGSANQRMLRTPIDFDAMEANVGGNYPSTLVTEVKDFCVQCHNPTVYAAGNDVDGSAFPNHAPGQNAHLNSNDLGCMGCHAGIVDEDKLTGIDNGAARGNIHGGSYVWAAGTKSPGIAADTFVVGGWMMGWLPVGGEVDCWGGECNHDKSPKSYTPPTP